MCFGTLFCGVAFGHKFSLLPSFFLFLLCFRHRHTRINTAVLLSLHSWVEIVGFPPPSLSLPPPPPLLPLSLPLWKWMCFVCVSAAYFLELWIFFLALFMSFFLFPLLSFISFQLSRFLAMFWVANSGSFSLFLFSSRSFPPHPNTVRFITTPLHCFLGLSDRHWLAGFSPVWRRRRFFLSASPPF